MGRVKTGNACQVFIRFGRFCTNEMSSICSVFNKRDGLLRMRSDDVKGVRKVMEFNIFFPFIIDILSFLPRRETVNLPFYPVHFIF